MRCILILTWKRKRDCGDSSVTPLTRHTRAASPVLPAPGVGQVGTGLENSWGLDEDVDEEDETMSGEDATIEEQQQHRKQTSEGLIL